jgi:hypothetical protein
MRRAPITNLVWVTKSEVVKGPKGQATEVHWSSEMEGDVEQGGGPHIELQPTKPSATPTANDTSSSKDKQ